MSSPAKITGDKLANLLVSEQEYPAPAITAASAVQKDWAGACRRSLEDPEGFWGDYAGNFVWSQPWQKVMEFDGAHHRWFLQARTNITLNALDRHALSEHRNRVAFIWLGEDGSERTVTYAQLHRMVCRLANGLKSLGVKK